MPFKRFKKKTPDICIIVEGSYPYIKGGVSSWVHQILENYSEFTFDLVVLVASDKEKYELQYKIPKNVNKIHHVYIRKSVKKPLFSLKSLFMNDKFQKFIDNFFRYKDYEKIVTEIQTLSSNKKTRLLQEVLYSKDAYDYLNNIYDNSSFNTKSYLDYYWSLKSIYFSFFNVLLSNIPKAKVYHTISTGYAGLFSSMCKIKNPKARVIITEHGIYTRERKMDITIADWADRNHEAYNPKNSISLYKEIWEKSFNLVSKITYKYCDEIISLNEKNNKIQINEGAKKRKVFFVRNGINLNKFKFKLREKINPNNPKIGFLGRIVKIKDVKTYIKSAKIVCEKYPNSEFLIAGPTSEDEKYYESCKNLIDALELNNQIKFIGLVQSNEFLEEIDLMVLTSLSEGQPLVLSEANACGVPCIATDVGGCKEMLEGSTEDTCGISGIITKSLNPKETADAIIKFIEDENFYKNASKNGRLRAETFYNETNFLNSYREIYTRNISKSKVN